MSITTGGGIGYDRAAFRAQRAQQMNDNLTRGAMFREQQLLNKAARLKDAWDWVTSLDQYKEDSDKFIADNPSLMQAMTEMASEITGRKLSSQQGLELATWLQKQGATNPTIPNAYNRAFRGNLNQVGPEGARPAGGSGPEGTSKAVPPPVVAPPPQAAPAPAAPSATPDPAGLVRGGQRPWTGGVANVPWAAARQPLAATKYLDNLGPRLSAQPQGTYQPPAQPAPVDNSPPALGERIAATRRGKALYDEAYWKFFNGGTSAEELDLLSRRYFSNTVGDGSRDPSLDFVIGYAAQRAAEARRQAGAEDPLQLDSYAAGKPSDGAMNPAELARHEVRTGDVHYPALVGVKEGIVNARAMENGGDAVVRALNDRYPVYAEGKGSGDGAPPVGMGDFRAMETRLTNAELAQRFRDFQQETAASMAAAPVPAGAGPGSVQGYPDAAELAPEAGPQLRVGSKMVKPIERALGKAAAETTKIAAAANQIVATSKGIGSKTPAAKVPGDFGKALEGLVAGADDLRMHLGGAPSKRVKDLALAQREAVRIGQITEDAYRALPAEQREAMLKKMDDMVQARSPEFWAAMGRQGVADTRSNSELRKVQMTQAMASMMASSSKQMADMLAPISQAYDRLGNLIQISQTEAKNSKKSLADFWNEEGSGMLGQINGLGAIIKQFAKSYGVTMDTQLFIKQMATGPFGLFKKNAIGSGDEANAAAAAGGSLEDMVNGLDPEAQEVYKRAIGQ